MIRELPNFYTGDSIDYTFDLRDNSGQPLNVRNAKIWFTMKRKPEDADSDAVIQLVFNVSPTDSDAFYGRPSINIPGDLTSSLPPTVYWWDMRIQLWNTATQSYGSAKAIGIGVVRCDQSVTRAYG